MSHSPEPWRARTRKVGGKKGQGVLKLGLVLGPKYVEYLGNLEFTPEDAHRIVACVNACKGVSNETLERVARGEVAAGICVSAPILP